MIVRVVIVGPLQENTYIVVCEETNECVIIDPGAESNKIINEIESYQFIPKYILNTHGHFDHTSAIRAVKNSTGALYGIRSEDEYLLKSTDNPGSAIISDFQDPPDPDFYLNEEDVLNIGSLTLRVLSTAGHTPGSVCFYTSGFVFTGDTLFKGSIGRYDFPGGDGHLLIQNIKTKLLTLPEDTYVLPGHGPQSTIGEEKLLNPFLQISGL